MYTSDSSHVVFLNGILNVFDMLCRTGQDEVLRQIFGNEFYMRFFNNYLDNLYQIEKKAEEAIEDTNGGT
jgi:hypothetical protein